MKKRIQTIHYCNKNSCTAKDGEFYTNLLTTGSRWETLASEFYDEVSKFLGIFLTTADFGKYAKKLHIIIRPLKPITNYHKET